MCIIQSIGSIIAIIADDEPAGVGQLVLLGGAADSEPTQAN